jgi:hypothetical protein
LATLFPIASITYSLTYAMSNKKRIRNIAARAGIPNTAMRGGKQFMDEHSAAGTWPERKNSMESLLDFNENEGADEEDEYIPAGGYNGQGAGRNQLVQNLTTENRLRKIESSSSNRELGNRSSNNYSVNSVNEAVEEDI